MNISNVAFVYGTGKLNENRMLFEAIDEQSTKRQGTGWNDEINKTPSDIKIEKKTAELWLNKTVINIAAKVEGIIVVNANCDKNEGTLVAKVVTA